MSVFTEIYDATGKLILSKDDKVLVNTTSYKLIPTNGSGDANFEYAEDMNVFMDAATGGEIRGTWLTPRLVAFPEDFTAPLWFSPQGTSTVLMIDKNLNSIFAGMYYCSIGVSRTGSGVKMLMTSRQSLNQYAGYFDVYNEAGELQWSVGSIVQAPKILTVAHIAPTLISGRDAVVVDLAPYGVDVTKCYALANNASRIDYSEVTFDYVGVLAKFVGTKLHLRPYYKGVNGSVQATVGTLFGAEGIYIPIAYMPNG